MAAGLDLDRSAPWNSQILRSHLNSPSAASTYSNRSSYTNTSAFSLDAPSSQSSVSSSSSSLTGFTSCQEWSNENEIAWSGCPTERPNTAVKDQGSPAPGTFFLQPNQSYAQVVAPESRQNPRRTQRLSSTETDDGKTILCPRPPPSLVRQSERKITFVDSLVDTTTQMVETIWPLSAYVQSRPDPVCTRQPSKMDLRYFIQEVLRRSKTSYSTLQVALYYLIRIRSCLPCLDFTMEQPKDSTSSFSLQCGRRMFIAALILASKYLQDRNFSANAWSKISGLSTWDLNINEMAFLSAIDWKLHIPEPVFHRWTDIVLKHSPSSQVHVPAHSLPRQALSWKEVVLRLTPELDNIDFGTAELSDDSGYDSPGSDMSPPPVPIHDQVVSRPTETTPSPSRGIPQWLEHTPRNEPRRTLPPLQPHLAPLPTPELTPQVGPFCTPAASTPGLFTRQPSMCQAMRQMQQTCMARSTLDCTSEWKPRVPDGFFLARRTSAGLSASSMSSPDSMSDVSTQYSDVSSRPSRSSSISSVASSTGAPGQPANLAIQATCRRANMQLNCLKEQARELEMAKATQTLEPDYYNNAGGSRPNGSFIITGNMPTPTTRQQLEAYNFPTSIGAAPSASTHEAASALQDLALNRPSASFLARRPGSTESSRKRARPNSMDLSVEDAVRQLIAPRCLDDISNMRAEQNALQSNVDEGSILSDDQPADSFLLRKENKHAVREAHKRPTKHNQRYAASAAANHCGAMSSRENQPRKKACAGSDRGGREEARMMERAVRGGEQTRGDQGMLWGEC